MTTVYERTLALLVAEKHLVSHMLWLNLFILWSIIRIWQSYIFPNVAGIFFLDKEHSSRKCLNQGQLSLWTLIPLTSTHRSRVHSFTSLYTYWFLPVFRVGLSRKWTVLCAERSPWGLIIPCLVPVILELLYSFQFWRLWSFLEWTFKALNLREDP